MISDQKNIIEKNEKKSLLPTDAEAYNDCEYCSLPLPGTVNNRNHNNDYYIKCKYSGCKSYFHLKCFSHPEYCYVCFIKLFFPYFEVGNNQEDVLIKPFKLKLNKNGGSVVITKEFNITKNTYNSIIRECDSSLILFSIKVPNSMLENSTFYNSMEKNNINGGYSYDDFRKKEDNSSLFNIRRVFTNSLTNSLNIKSFCLSNIICSINNNNFEYESKDNSNKEPCFILSHYIKENYNKLTFSYSNLFDNQLIVLLNVKRRSQSSINRSFLIEKDSIDSCLAYFKNMINYLNLEYQNIEDISNISNSIINRNNGFEIKSLITELEKNMNNLILNYLDYILNKNNENSEKKDNYNDDRNLNIKIKQLIPLLFNQSNIKRLLDNNNLQSDYIDLICSISLTEITLPVRSRKCNHISVFDYSNFRMMQSKYFKWKCPNCNKQVFLNELEIDFFSMFLISLLNYLKNSEIVSISLERIKVQCFKSEFVVIKKICDNSNSDVICQKNKIVEEVICVINIKTSDIALIDEAGSIIFGDINLVESLITQKIYERNDDKESKDGDEFKLETNNKRIDITTMDIDSNEENTGKDRDKENITLADGLNDNQEETSDLEKEKCPTFILLGKKREKTDLECNPPYTNESVSLSPFKQSKASISNNNNSNIKIDKKIMEISLIEEGSESKETFQTNTNINSDDYNNSNSKCNSDSNTIKEEPYIPDIICIYYKLVSYLNDSIYSNFYSIYNMNCVNEENMTYNNFIITNKKRELSYYFLNSYYKSISNNININNFEFSILTTIKEYSFFMRENSNSTRINLFSMKNSDFFKNKSALTLFFFLNEIGILNICYQNRVLNDFLFSKFKCCDFIYKANRSDNLNTYSILNDIVNKEMKTITDFILYYFENNKDVRNKNNFYDVAEEYIDIIDTALDVIKEVDEKNKKTDNEKDCDKKDEVNPQVNSDNSNNDSDRNKDNTRHKKKEDNMHFYINNLKYMIKFMNISQSKVNSDICFDTVFNEISRLIVILSIKKDIDEKQIYYDWKNGNVGGNSKDFFSFSNFLLTLGDDDIDYDKLVNLIIIIAYKIQISYKNEGILDVYSHLNNPNFDISEEKCQEEIDEEILLLNLKNKIFPHSSQYQKDNKAHKKPYCEDYKNQIEIKGVPDLNVNGYDHIDDHVMNIEEEEKKVDNLYIHTYYDRYRKSNMNSYNKYSNNHNHNNIQRNNYVYKKKRVPTKDTIFNDIIKNNRTKRIEKKCNSKRERRDSSINYRTDSSTDSSVYYKKHALKLINKNINVETSYYSKFPKSFERLKKYYYALQANKQLQQTLKEEELKRKNSNNKNNSNDNSCYKKYSIYSIIPQLLVKTVSVILKKPPEFLMYLINKFEDCFNLNTNSLKRFLNNNKNEEALEFSYIRITEFYGVLFENLFANILDLNHNVKDRDDNIKTIKNKKKHRNLHLNNNIEKLFVFNNVFERNLFDICQLFDKLFSKLRNEKISSYFCEPVSNINTRRDGFSQIMDKIILEKKEMLSKVNNSTTNDKCNQQDNDTENNPNNTSMSRFNNKKLFGNICKQEVKIEIKQEGNNDQFHFNDNSKITKSNKIQTISLLDSNNNSKSNSISKSVVDQFDPIYYYNKVNIQRRRIDPTINSFKKDYKFYLIDFHNFFFINFIERMFGKNSLVDIVDEDLIDKDSNANKNNNIIMNVDLLEDELKSNTNSNNNIVISESEVNKKEKLIKNIRRIRKRMTEVSNKEEEIRIGKKKINNFIANTFIDIWDRGLQYRTIFNLTKYDE